MKIKPFATTPDEYVDFMRLHVSELNQYTWEQSFVYLSLIWCNVVNPKRFEHKDSPNRFFVPYRALKERLGTNYQSTLHAIPLIEMGKYYQAANGQTRKFKLTPIAKELTSRFIASQHRKIKLLSQNAKPIQLCTRNRLPNAIRSKDERGRPAQHDAVVNPLVTISLMGLTTLISDLQKPLPLLPAYLKKPFREQPPAKSHEWIEERLQKARLILLLAKDEQTPPNQIIQRYEEKLSGRLYGLDAHLQNMPREVRRAALQGQNEYDIDNCHFVLFQHLSEKTGIVLPQISDYVKDKQTLRARLANKLKIPITMVKRVLLSLLFGAGLSLKPNEALMQTVGDINTAKKIRDDSTFKNIRKEVGQATSAIIKQHETRTGVVNAMGKLIRKGEDNKAKLAHILQGQESAILKIILSLHSESITLLQHDGFTSTADIDCHFLAAQTYKKTGFKISLKKAFPKQQRVLCDEITSNVAA